MSSRKPLNTENEVDIFTHTASNNTSETNILTSNGRDNRINTTTAVKADRTEAKTDRTIRVNQKPINNLKNTPPLKNNTNNNNNANQNNTLKKQLNSMESSEGFSPSRMLSFGMSAPRIVKRELWWKEQHTEFKVPDPKPFKPIVAAPKIDNKMPNYSPPISQRSIQSRKLQWNVQPAVNTWENFHHQPGGGNKRYPVEHVEWNALPKIDSGFIYTFNDGNQPNIFQEIKEDIQERYINS